MDNQIFQDLQKAYGDLVNACQNCNIYNDIKKLLVLKNNINYVPPSINSVLQQVEQLRVTINNLFQDDDLPITQKDKNNKSELVSLLQNPELITTSDYTQRLLHYIELNKQVKQECVDCALLHAQSGLPTLKEQQNRLKQCQLFTYKIGNEQEFRHLKSIVPNVHQINPIIQESALIPNRFAVHISVFHPFSKKKTQEMVANNDTLISDIIKEIECPVEETEIKYYQEEMKNFEEPILTLGDKDKMIGQIKFQICKQYHYIHLNQCKHWVYIQEIRSLTKNEVEPFTIYTVFKAPKKIKACEGCGRSAELFRIQDKLIAGTPVYLCRFCDEQLHTQDVDEEGLPYICD